LAVLNYQAAILSNDEKKAETLLPSIPESYYGKLSKFLESNGKKELAFNLTPDQDHKFDLALALNRMEEAHKIAEL
jgi:coatomer subunit beta'